MVRAATAAKFPSTLLTVADIGVFTNDEAATVVLDHIGAATTIDVDDASAFTQYMWLVERGSNGLEVLQVTDVNLILNRITVTRGLDGTVAVPHVEGETIEATIPAIALNQMRDELIAHATFLGVDGECVHWNRGLELEPSTDTCAILTLNLRSARTNKKFIQFSVDDVETGAMLYDAANDAIEFQNIRVDIGTGADILLEDNRTLRLGTSSTGLLLYDSVDARVEYRSDAALRFESITGSTEILTLTTTSVTSNKHVLPRTDNTFDLGSAAQRWRGLYVGPASIHVLNAASDANDAATLSGTGLYFGAGGATAVDVRVFRDQANRLAIESGDDFNIVLGNLQMAGTTLFEADRDLAVDLLPNANSTLNLGSLTRTYMAAYSRALTSDAGLVLTPASGSNLNLSVAAAGGVQIAGTTVFESDRDVAVTLLPNADNTLNLGSPARRWANLYAGAITSGHILPSADNTYDLGSASFRWRDIYASGSSFRVIAVAGDANPTSRLGSATLAFGAGGASATDVQLSRGGADLLQLESGDSLNIVLGNLQLAGTTLFESDRDLAVDLIPNADNILSLGSAARRFNDLYLGPTSLHILNAASDANDLVSLGSAGLQFGAGGASALDITMSRGAANRLDLASGDSLRIATDGTITSGQLQFGAAGDAILYRSAANRLQALDTEIQFNRGTATGSAITALSIDSGDTLSRFVMDVSGSMNWGPGNAARDVTLSRTATDVLSLASGDTLVLATDGSTGGLKLGASGDVSLYRIGAGQLGFDSSAAAGRMVLAISAANPTISMRASTADANAATVLDITAGLRFGAGGGSALDTQLSRGAANRFDIATGDSLSLVSGNIMVGTSAVGTSGNNVLALFNGTAPTTSPADTVQLFSLDNNGAGTATLGLRTEQAVNAQVAASTHTLRVVHNGTVYGILLTNVPT